jgi:putative membrane protein
LRRELIRAAATVTHLARFSTPMRGVTRADLKKRRREMKRYGFLTMALVAAVTIGCNSTDRNDVNANKPAGSAVGTAGTSEVSNGDKNFVKDVSAANMAEIELGRLATEKGTNPAVKKFGQMMIDDHTKAGDALSAVASQHSIAMATELDDKHKDLQEKLSTLSGADFDREYIDAMVDGHNDVLDKLGSRVDKKSLEDYKAKTADRVTGEKIDEKVEATAIVPEKSDNAATMSINEWAASSYPVVQAHFQSAKSIQDTLKKRMTN